MAETGREPKHPGTFEDSNADEELAPADAYDPIIDAYKKDVDRTLLRENLKLTPEERARKLVSFARFAGELREAGRRARANDPAWGQ